MKADHECSFKGGIFSTMEKEANRPGLLYASRHVYHLCLIVTFSQCGLKVVQLSKHDLQVKIKGLSKIQNKRISAI